MLVLKWPEKLERHEKLFLFCHREIYLFPVAAEHEMKKKEQFVNSV